MDNPGCMCDSSYHLTAHLKQELLSERRDFQKVVTVMKRWWALGALAICLLTLGLDGTILNVALPTLATALGAGTDGLQWMVDAYILVFAGLLIPLGALGDRVGRKRMLIIGLLAFLAASIGAAYCAGA